MLTFVVFFFVLSVLVLAHEFGHFLAAKKTGIKVEEFGFGYPPRLFAKKIRGTIYSFNAVPFGGFVRLYGEELESLKTKDQKPKTKFAFWAKSKKARTGVILAGVLANFLLAIVCFSIVYSVSGIPTQTGAVKILEIAKDSPADKFGLEVGDVILSVNEEKIDNLEKFTNLVAKNKTQQIKLIVERNIDNPCLEKVFGDGVGFSCQNGNLVLWVTPRETPPEGEGPLGVMVSDVQMIKYPFWQMPFRGAVEGLKEAFGWGMLVLFSLKKMFLDLLFQGVIPKDIAGPIGIFQVTGGVARRGVLIILQFIGVLSVNLAVLNVLPLPALDGGRLIFIAYELVTRRRPKPSLERWVNTAGMAFLIFLIILVTINDINRIVDFSSLSRRFQLLWPNN